MTAHPPPVPPEQRSPYAGATPADQDKAGDTKGDPNLAEQGRQGNIAQNTTHKGFQQDRGRHPGGGCHRRSPPPGRDNRGATRTAASRRGARAVTAILGGLLGRTPSETMPRQATDMAPGPRTNPHVGPSAGRGPGRRSIVPCPGRPPGPGQQRQAAGRSSVLIQPGLRLSNAS